MVKQRVETSVYEELDTSIPEGVQDRRTLIDGNDDNFNALTEIRIRETTMADGREAVATQFCTGSAVELAGFTTTEPGLLFLMAAHCDTDAPLGGFHVDLDLSYVDEQGQSQTVHLETQNPEHVWNSSTYGGYTTEGEEHGDNDLSLIFIPTNQRLPDAIQPLAFNPAQNNELVNQYGASLMIPTAGADSTDMRVDRNASLKQNHGPGESAEMDAHVSVSTSGAPVIPHVGGEPIRDNEGRIVTIGPIASIATETGVALFANPDPEIFANAPFLRPTDGQVLTNIASADQGTIETIARQPQAVTVDVASQQLDVGEAVEVDAFLLSKYLTDTQSTDLPEMQYVPEAQYESFASTLDLGLQGGQGYATTAEPNSLLLQKINDIAPIATDESDVFFNINHTDQGYVVSDASEFMARDRTTEFASNPQNEGALLTIKF